MKMSVAIVYQFLDLVDSAPIWSNFFMWGELVKKIGLITLLNKNKMRKITIL